MHHVRTTLAPHKEIEVDDAEYADLKAQGLLVSAEQASNGTPSGSGATPTGGE